MKIPKTVQLGHPALSQVAVDVTPDQCPELAAGLDRAMRKAGMPAGLALPQLGVSLRGFAISAHLVRTGQRQMRFCFNTEFMWDEIAGTTIEAEECLSLPGKTYFVERYNRITARYLDKNGRPVEEELSGVLARVWQHEADHLDGVLISSPLRAKMPKLDENMRPVSSQRGMSALLGSVLAAGGAMSGKTSIHFPR